MGVVEKSPDAFRTISEVADELDLPQHVLRFWETRFTQIRPLKRGGGRRYYRPDDVELLRGIRHLLYDEGYTIKGVQRILKEQGQRFVMTLLSEGMGNLPVALATQSGRDDREATSGGGAPRQSGAAEPSSSRAGASPRLRSASRETTPSEELSAEAMARALSPARRSSTGAVSGEEKLANGERTAPYKQSVRFNDAETPDAGQPSEFVEEEALPRGLLADDAPERTSAGARGGFRFMDRFLGERDDSKEEGGQLSRDDIRRLQSTLFELLECKRILDQSR